MQFCCDMSFTLPKKSQNLDPSYKTDLDFWIVLEGKNTVL